jgi:triphosphoribosyl-dephospho-CoA synthetase
MTLGQDTALALKTPMTDPEREHFLRQIHDLQRRSRRWRLACLVMLGVLLLPVVLGGLLGVTWVPRLERERAARLDAEREREQLEYYQRILEAERQMRQAEEGAQRGEQQEPRDDKH